MKDTNVIQIWDKSFRPYIQEKDIQERVRQIGARINLEYEGRWPLFIVVLNGAFMFAADLFRSVAISCEITFVKLQSYEGLESTGLVKTVIGLNESIKDRDIIIVEDIVDTGLTLQMITEQLEEHEPASISSASLLLKPDALQIDVSVDYIGFKVPNNFLLGYGLDYNGRGRNLKDIYTLEDQK
jgi:hypoxanthine phosphoribosyltransferase